MITKYYRFNTTCLLLPPVTVKGTLKHWIYTVYSSTPWKPRRCSWTSTNITLLHLHQWPTPQKNLTEESSRPPKEGHSWGPSMTLFYDSVVASASCTVWSSQRGRGRSYMVFVLAGSIYQTLYSEPNFSLLLCSREQKREYENILSCDSITISRE